MFCSNCGKEILENQRFCPSCGAENIGATTSGEIISMGNSSPQTIKTSQSNVLFNRDVMNNYLYNLQALEFSKSKLEREKERKEYIISYYGQPRYVPKRSLSNYGSDFGGIAFMVGVFLLALLINSGLKGDGFLSIFRDLLSPIISIVMVLAIIIAAILFFVFISSYIKDGQEQERREAEESARLNMERKEKAAAKELLPLIERDLEKTEHLLQEAYSINIIPAKYRNIYGVYFLYDYMSTSVVSLSEALFHCDLDKISEQLDDIIELQEQMIVALAQSNVLNQQLVQQNDQILQHAIATERNTAMAAQYSQVAAINSETVSTIQSYYFFKNGL